MASALCGCRKSKIPPCRGSIRCFLFYVEVARVKPKMLVNGDWQILMEQLQHCQTVNLFVVNLSYYLSPEDDSHFPDSSVLFFVLAHYMSSKLLKLFLHYLFNFL